jgi:glyoxylase-like metal-dependent hydrolase (beta-lactamase superfamily II)
MSRRSALAAGAAAVAGLASGCAARETQPPVRSAVEAFLPGNPPPSVASSAAAEPAGGGIGRVRHLGCGTMCPVGGRLMYGARPEELRCLVCHCLLIETAAHGLVLVDTGLGLGDVRAPRPRLSPFFLDLDRVKLREEDTALRQVERLGHRAGDVRHIVLTHLDFDHAGGVEDFPEATVHVLGAELAAARQERQGFIARNRYRPQQWDGGVRWREYGAAPGGEPWFGFRAVRDLEGLPPEILMVPLVGHTWGHCGVAVRGPSGWLLHAGDAYFHQGEMDPATPSCPPGLRAYQRMMEVDRASRLGNQERLRELARARAGEVVVFSGHDRAELAALQRGQAAA